MCDMDKALYVGVTKQLKKKAMAIGEIAKETILATKTTGTLP